MKRLALLLAFLPPASVTLACNCPDEGSYAEIIPESAAKEPQIAIGGDARIECMHRNARDYCDGFWIIPGSAGTVTVTLQFSDGTVKSDSIEYIHDGTYPCRGDLRPVHDHASRL